MGILSRFFTSILTSNNSSDNTSGSTYDIEDEAMRFFDYQDVEYYSSADVNAITNLYKALNINNKDTYDDSNIKDAVSTLDVNLYTLCNAIIDQNFMLMRKVDFLIKRLSALEERLSGQEDDCNDSSDS